MAVGNVDFDACAYASSTPSLRRAAQYLRGLEAFDILEDSFGDSWSQEMAVAFAEALVLEMAGV